MPQVKSPGDRAGAMNPNHPKSANFRLKQRTRIAISQGGLSSGATYPLLRQMDDTASHVSSLTFSSLAFGRLTTELMIWSHSAVARCAIALGVILDAP
jgi:hypothetical protein